MYMDNWFASFTTGTGGAAVPYGGAVRCGTTNYHMPNKLNVKRKVMHAAPVHSLSLVDIGRINGRGRIDAVVSLCP